MKILDVINLRLGFGNNPDVIKGISFSLEKGKTLGIVGESGSGKSLTAFSIINLLPSKANIKSGSVQFSLPEKSPVNLLQLDKKGMQGIRGKHISMIFQEPMTALNPVLTCGFQTGEGLQVHMGLNKKEVREEVLRLFKEVEMPDPVRAYHSYPHELSGGQKQRVMIALALACKPSLILADEPTTALDVTLQKKILNLLKKLIEEYGSSMIFISHDLAVVSQMCDEVAVMYKGELVEYGKVEEVFRNPRHEYTKGLMACRPDIYKKTYRLAVIADFISKNSDTLQLREMSREEEKAKMTDICSGTKLLEVNNLNLKYPVRKGFFSKTKSWVTAIDNINFELYKGESLGLVGESGSGKTSLGKVILRVQEADSGNIFYKNRDITKLEGSELRKLRKEIQVVFQDPYGSLNPSLTINSALAEPILVHKLASGKKEALEKVAFLLESVGIDPALGTRFPHEFSGGQRQRICIARALTVEPEFIVCDEAVSALDVSVQAQVLNLLADLQEKFNLSYLFITHDLSVVRFLCSRVMVMKSGKLEETLPVYDLLEQAKENYTKELIASIPGRFS